MHYLATLTSVFAVMLVPVVASAQFGEINDFLGDVSTFINGTLIPLLFAFALLLFIYGAFLFFVNPNEEEKSKGRNYILYAIIGFFFAVSIFGIVNLIAGGLGFSDEENIENIPNVPVSNT